MPKLTHPKTKHTIEVAPDQVRLYASQGWAEKAAPKKKPSARTNQANDADNKE
ncbi:MAG TPA: hypothetical protein VJL80_06465 [Aeromicrobium sp.]|nr:hypothetical protein [Aeromicrobium sp.]HKY57662.1 hypothetical protein [Aeromicrobium sp.]